MRTAWSVALSLAVVFAFVLGARAEEGKKVTLTGKLTCAKCDLKKADSCETVLVVTKGGQETVYHLDKTTAKKHHKEICRGGKEATVTGTVSGSGDEKTIKVSKLEYK